MSHFISASTTAHLFSWLTDRLLFAALLPVILVIAAFRPDPKLERATDSAARRV